MALCMPLNNISCKQLNPCRTRPEIRVISELKKAAGCRMLDLLMTLYSSMACMGRLCMRQLA